MGFAWHDGTISYLHNENILFTKENHIRQLMWHNECYIYFATKNKGLLKKKNKSTATGDVSALKT